MTNTPTPAVDELAMAYDQTTVRLSSDSPEVPVIRGFGADLAREIEVRLRELEIPTPVAADVIMLTNSLAAYLHHRFPGISGAVVLNIVAAAAVHLRDGTAPAGDQS